MTPPLSGGSPLRDSTVLYPGGASPNVGSKTMLPSGDGAANPFAQFDPAPSQQASSASPADQVNTSTAYNQIGQDQAASPEDAKRAEELRTGVARMINDGSSRDQINDMLFHSGVDPSSVTGLDDALAYRDHHRGVAIGVFLKANHAPPTAAPEINSGDGFVGSALRGVADGATLGGVRWLHGLGNALGVGTGSPDNVWNSNQSFGDLMKEGREAWDAKVNYDADQHPVGQIGGEVVGSLALPVGGEIGGAGHVLPAAIGRVATGAGEAAVYGFNQGEHSLGDRLANAGTSALVAGGIGSTLEGAGALGRWAVRGGAEQQQAARETFAAADRLNAGAPASDAITPLPAHVGGPLVRGTSSALKHTLVGGSIMDGGLRDFVSNTAGARDRVADSVAPGVSATDPEALAARLGDPNNPAGLSQFEDRWRAANDRNYKRALWLAADETIPTPNTIQAIDDRIAELSGAPGNPHAAAIDKLSALANDLEDNSYTADKLRLTRTDWGKSVDANDGVLRGMSKTIYGTLTQDIDSGLRNAGRVGAAQHFAKADAAYADGLDFINNSLPKVLGVGTADPDKVLDNINGLVSSHQSSTLMRVLNTAPADVSAQVRGSIIARLGRTPVDPVSGRAGFSAPIFIRQWDKLSSTAKSALFDPQTISSLNDVRTVAAAAVRSGIQDNTSRTAATAANRSVLDGMGDLLLQGTHALGSAGSTLVAHLGTEAAFGYLLSRPGVARALAGVMRGGNPAALTRRVGAIAAKAARQFPTLPYNSAALSGASQPEAMPNVSVDPSQTNIAAAPAPTNPFAQFDK